jgi:hypothetical protein
MCLNQFAFKSLLQNAFKKPPALNSAGSLFESKCLRRGHGKERLVADGRRVALMRHDFLHDINRPTKLNDNSANQN